MIKNIKTLLSAALLAALVLSAPVAVKAYQPDYGQDVEFLGRPSPVDAKTGSSVNQYGTGETNSQIDNYLNQDEQINLSGDSGTVRVLRTNQKDMINSYVTAFVPLKNVNVRELRGLARTICRKEGGDADVLNDKVRNRNGIVVVCPPHMVPYITRTLQAIDQAWVQEIRDGSWYTYYRAQNRDARNIINILKFYRTPDASWEFDDANNAFVFYDQPCIEPLFRKGVAEIDIPPSQLLLDVAVYELDTQNDLTLGLDWVSWKNGPGRDLFQLVGWDFWGDRIGFPGSLPANAADWGTFSSYNFLFTTAYIDFLQTKGKARLITKSTITTKSGSVGELSAVDQVLSFASDSSSAKSPAAIGEDNLAPYRLSDVYEFYHENDAIDPSLEDLVELDADAVQAKVTILLKNVLCLSDAVVNEVIEELKDKSKDGRIDREELEQTLVPLAVTLQVFRDRTLRYVNSGSTGVLLTVYPVVGLESAEVALSIDVSDVSGYTPAGLPIIEHRFLSSQVEMHDGEPMVLGGLKRQATVKTSSGIPFLRDIPVVGYVFGREVTTKREREMVVLMTPRFKLCPLSEPNPPRELVTVSNLAKAAEQTADPVKSVEKSVQVPKTAFGFDQWLLDGVAARRMDGTE